MRRRRETGVPFGGVRGLVALRIVVGFQGSLGGGVVRIDPDSLEVVATVPVEAAKPFQLVAAHGAVWFSQTSASPANPAVGAFVQRIDPATNEVVAAVQLPVRIGEPFVRLAAGPNAVWALGDSGSQVEGGGEIWRIDPTTNAVTETINLEDDLAVGVPVFADGLMWVGVEPPTFRTSTTAAADAPYAVVGIDPGSERTISRIEVIDAHGSGATTRRPGLAEGAGALWLITHESLF